ncbi:MAG: arginine--tRNA ligase [Planctomycetota bacterium]
MSLIGSVLAPWLQSTLSLKADPRTTGLGPSRDASADITLPAFIAAKTAGKNPAAIATEWAALLANNPHPLIASVKSAGPYLNITLDPAATARLILDAVLGDIGTWAHSTEHHGETVCMDFSSPNIAKPFAIHHLRSTLIGAALGNVLETQGYAVERINHLGDWGTQFGYVMLGWSRLKPPTLPSPQEGEGSTDRLLGDKPLHTLVGIYQHITKEAKEAAARGDNSLEEGARDWFLRLEKGDKEARRLWQWFRDVSVKELELIYNRMGIHFDAFRGEAHYESHLADTLRLVKDKGVLETSEGAEVVRLGDDMPPVLLRKGDGATLYATRDLAALLDRWNRQAFALNLYVVASQQNLHFQQLFALVEKLGHPSAGRNRHVSFGMLRLPDGSLGKTRDGNVIFLDEVLDAAHEKALERLAPRREADPSLPETHWDSVAEMVGLGAVFFNDLKARRDKDVIFKWDDILSFEGRTGAYLQYAQCRMNSILRKGSWSDGSAHDPLQLTHPMEKSLLLMLDRYPSILSESARELEPNTVLNYLFELVQVYSRLTQDKEGGVKVLDADPAIRQARLALVAATRHTLRHGLKVLCIPTPEQM